MIIKKGEYMEAIANWKNTCEDFAVEFEVIPPINLDEEIDERKRRILNGLAVIDEQLEENQKILDELNTEIDRLTNHADGIDYMVAVASGVLTGMVDIIFVEDFSLDKANDWGNRKTNNFIIKMAQKNGYKGNDLQGAVKFLEDKYHIAADKVTNKFGGARQHHIRDFSHHPTPIGLLFSLLTQFTNRVYGTDTAGFFQVVELQKDDMILIGKNFHEKITFGLINWFFHMVSDMAGSTSSISKGNVGTGLPGPLVSLLKEISALPIFRKLNDKGNKEFSVWISKLFNGTLLGKKFDLRTEIGILHQLGKQAVPVIINECIVRGFYFVRRFFMELRDNHIREVSELGNVNWQNTLPFKNRTVIRMLTISTGTMTVIDLADAAIEAAIKSGGVGPAFVANMLVKVNFVGVGRFAIAVGTDIKMGVKRSKLRNERIVAMNEYIFLLNGKMFYKQAEMWIAAESVRETIEEAYVLMEKTAELYARAYSDMKLDLKRIGTYVPNIEKKNKDLLEEMNDILKWGK